MPVTAPRLPFPGYKWHWASVQPSEGLNNPDVFLGVLRTLADYEGSSPGDPAVLARLATVKTMTGTRIDLVRTSKRNLIRNSGQYWAAFGLLATTPGIITLTDLGRRVASGAVTQSEFASATVRSHVLPNPVVEDTAPWLAAGLEIRPLMLIIQVMAALAARGAGFDYLTRPELVKIVIPLAGEKRPIPDYVAALLSHRAGTLSVMGWPDCAPAANDTRIAGEFLRFLEEYGFCVKEDVGGADARYHLLLKPDEVVDFMTGPAGSLAVALATVRTAGAAALVERSRRTVEVIARPGQTAFRRRVLAAYGRTCFLTGTAFEDVLEAAHIRPVKARGSDLAANGICLRSDMHGLFDAGHIRIDPAGAVMQSEALVASAAYALPRRVAWPAFLDPANIGYRWDYL